MKTISVTIEDNVLLAADKLIEDRKFSETINDLLKTYFSLENNDFFKEKNSLLKEKEDLDKRSKEVTTKLLIINKKEQENKEKTKQQTLQSLEGLRRNNPLRNMI